ncbi:hypothetical protein AB0A95_28535 [Micromonospora sp. NPDC049230]|uniref:hypothetical protein n=1 Tax=unclassified Micromonospora TaxID=2617518 RepID=UPI0033E87E98
MTVAWVVAGIGVAVAGLAYVVVLRRGRSAPGDDLAGRDARARQQRYEAERHGDQGDTWQRGRESSG